MYNDKVMDHFQNPRNTGEMESPDAEASIGNPHCGDVMKIYIKVEDNRIVDLKYKTFGCAAAIATSSIGSEMLIGKTLEEAEALTKDDIVEALGGLPEQKIHCSTLTPDAIKAAVAEYRNR